MRSADLAAGAAPLVVVAPDKFKGSVTAPAAAAALVRGLRRAWPAVRTIEHPIADGGEGTVDMVLGHGFRPITCSVHGPTGEPVQARYALRGDVAVVEMAAAAGLALLPAGVPDDDTARSASTFGVGELIRDALDRGARHIVLGIGGSATTDGGAGMAAALGARLSGPTGPVLPEGGASLFSADRLELAGLDARLRETTVVVACDVDNPLTGPAGAAVVYGPQKGAGRRPSRCSTEPSRTGRTWWRPRPRRICARCRGRVPPAVWDSVPPHYWVRRSDPASTTSWT